MQFMAICKDIKPSPIAMQLRLEHLQSHLNYIESIIDWIQVAGPLSPPTEDGYHSSCFIYQADSFQQAVELLDNDPYVKAGLYDFVSWHRFSPKAGHWVGGKNW